MEQVIKILEEIKPGVDYSVETDLIGDKILDSLKIVQLVSELNDEFDIEITPIDIVPENFKSAEAIYAMVKRLDRYELYLVQLSFDFFGQRVFMLHTVAQKIQVGSAACFKLYFLHDKQRQAGGFSCYYHRGGVFCRSVYKQDKRRLCPC